ncbi:sigma-70 family RNA polymerase sigma factor [Hymenobacter sp. 15J16-1T3B]|uniref:RNA polymerase sigma factor n=1 Tax=Hymenobacter sp. 15J16-1T3B TaxID=2886941 RepID=UPI001D1271F4|nr:sigma-70 family RNA polymerase sigma factor [Hymenobacter sp. 15J16-1T3B]MCC3157950.1 sigma-70 family RNA polymerase sigma factor [Hymenobacter sp. 15J16-1T3B]
MEQALTILPTSAAMTEQNDRLQQAVREQRGKLLSFIRRRIPDEDDAEDVLQDVFYELVQTYRLVKPVEQMAAWLFRVARNKIIDRYRRPKTASLEDAAAYHSAADSDEPLLLADILPAPDDSTETAMARETIMEAILDALEELPAAQREVFVWHEFEGKTFKQMAEETGVPLKTLISRKHYAVQQLRVKLQALYDDLFLD